jgi:oligopeptidase B
MDNNKPPAATRKPHTYAHHGITVEDPWHWLQDPGYPKVEDEEILSYLRQENAYFESVMASAEELTSDLFEEIRGRIREDDAAVPWQEGNYIYRWRFDIGSEYRIWTRRPADAADDTEEAVMLHEPSEAEGLDYYSVADLAVSPDGRLMAWSVDTSGAERFTIRVKNLATGDLLPDEIAEAHGEIVWASDSSGFFYTLVNNEWRPDKAVWHALGETEDTLIYEEEEASFFVGLSETQSSKFLIIGAGDHVTSEARIVPLASPLTAPVIVAYRKTGHEYHVDHARDHFVISTNDRHKNFRIVTAPETNPSQALWRELLSPSDTTYYRGFVPFHDFLAVQVRTGGLDQIRIQTWDGDSHTIGFPESVFAAGISTNPEYSQSHLRVSYQSMITPSSTYDYDVTEQRLDLRKQQEIPSGYDKSGYATERLMAPARDGVQVPITIVYPNDYPRDGTGKLHLYGYGAYGAGTSPGFSASRLSLLDRGMAYAIAHVRGGDEMGYAWYEDGKLDKRTNTFNDFVDVARHLIDQGLAAKGQISASGGSAGGELMGAAIIQAPDLWRAVVLHVPFVDVLNTMLDDSLPLTPIEWPEWGNPIEDAEAFRNIQSYSPYDNIEAREYPMQMVTGGLNDPRVTYWEPAKWTAKMRAMKTDDNPIVMKINMGAGHGGKTGRFEQIRETAEEFAFVLKAFDLAN